MLADVRRELLFFVDVRRTSRFSGEIILHSAISAGLFRHFLGGQKRLLGPSCARAMEMHCLIRKQPNFAQFCTMRLWPFGGGHFDGSEQFREPDEEFLGAFT